MDWLKWLIPLIALAVWILTNLARNREEPRRPMRSGNPPAAGDSPGGPRPRRSAAEIEDFLKEVRRRREVSEQRKRKAPVRAESVRAEPVRVEPLRETPRLRPAITVPEPTTASALPMPLPARPERAVPTSVPVAAPGQEEVVVARLVEPERSAYSAPAALPTLGKLLPGGRGGAGIRGNPAQLRQLLRQPQSLAAAIVLREILEPPVCRRRRGR